MKTTTEELTIGRDLQLQIEKKRSGNRLRVTLALETVSKCLLHWGLCRHRNAPWQLPPPKNWPTETQRFGRDALQTAFQARGAQRRITIDLPPDGDFSYLAFVLFFPEENYWDNNHDRNYAIKLPRNDEALLTPAQALRADTEGKEIVFQQIFSLSNDRQLATAVLKEGDSFQISLVTDIPGRLVLHWGITTKNRFDWQPPSRLLRPARTEMVDDRAAQTLFTNSEEFNRLHLVWRQEEAVQGITFVLYLPDSGQWLQDGQGNFYIPVLVSDLKANGLESAIFADVAAEIVAREMGRNSWTLMHRFNLCHDLLDRVGREPHGLALLFIWLRFSAIRQLDWQRNYNTQPRELSHAQKRLTVKLAGLYRDSGPEAREVIRLLLTTVGRGGEGGRGQRIRDEILEIMHRHKIKEVSGHFMEEWHQKIHNNATADDIVICEAYLGFLRSNGDLSLFYKILADGGVSKKRLEHFERPIVTDPDFVPHLKDGLIYDFENYLNLLKSVHSATDLSSALEAAGHCLDNRLRDQVASIYHARDDHHIGVRDRVSAITEARSSLNNQLRADISDQCVRDLLYLDLALEDFVRVVVERQIHQEIGTEHQVDLIGLVIDNVLFSHEDKELAGCLKQWQRLREVSVFDQDWALHARAVLDRVALALGGFIDYYDALLQAKAEYLGNSFAAESWTVELFTQEVVRGSAAYVLSILLRHINPLLRQAVKLGDWQIISQNDAAGWVENAVLLDVQERKYDRPTVIITDKVTGDEEIPEGVVGVITPSEIDILSHVSVRARNARVLFATCYDQKIINKLKSSHGQSLKFLVKTSGEVDFQNAAGNMRLTTAAEKIVLPTISCRPVSFGGYGVSSRDFTDQLVGGKSLQLMALRGKLPAWIHLPRSVAVPFCVCERVLAAKQNEEVWQRYNTLLDQVDTTPREILPRLRESVMDLNAPPEMRATLHEVMVEEGMGWPADWETLWTRIKHVWASKWNERAFWSRKKWRIPHDRLYMAVLIQEVVDAEYAFVIHTVSPFGEVKEELYAEVVFGLGETLCSGNYPGRALSFSCRKGKTLTPQLKSYPGKSIALKGAGLIMRSDSNGEDLDGFAGAGLYDSVLLKPPREESPDYADNPLLWQEEFRLEFMRNISKIGIVVEKALGGCPQDIEGAYADGKYFVVQTRSQVGCKP